MAHVSTHDIEQLLAALTLEEKVSLLSGADTWQTQQVGRLGIGSIKTTDGPSGARGHLSVGGPTAAFLPGPICQAATWSKQQLRSIGRLLCEETKTKVSQVSLAPTICLVRNPLGGRNFESFGEDPFLTGSLAIEYVSGLQESGEVMATPKHFVANEQEFQRFSIDVQCSEKTLREMYRKPFEMVVRSSSPPGCIMTSYNVINGLHADMNTHLLQQILRDDWGFKGLVMSDWGGTNSIVESVMAGCDLEMPGPSLNRGALLLGALKAAINPDELMSAIDRSVTRVLLLCKRLGLLGLSEKEAEGSRWKTERSTTSEEGIKLMRSVAAEGMVLLKNDKAILPLKPHLLSGKRVAFIGPNAKEGASGGGGSATMNPQYLSQPMESFKNAVKAHGLDVDVVYSLGANAKKWLPLLQREQLQPAILRSSSEAVGSTLIRIDFYASIDLSGPILETQYRDNSLIDLLDSAPIGLQQRPVPPYSFRVTCTIRPQTSGTHLLSVANVGETRVYEDGVLILENCNWTERSEVFYAFGSREKTVAQYMQEGKSYNVVVEAWTKVGAEDDHMEHVFAAHPSVRIGFQEELPRDMISEAVKVADESDYTVVVLGLDGEWESEGYDRQSMALPGDQNEMAEALLSKCKNPERLIFINQSGSPVEFPWANKCNTLLQAWYGGQEAGNAMADLLLGIVNPSGRMPITWPYKYEDLPFIADKETWPGLQGVVSYKEGCYIGHRYFLHHGHQPQFWFGYGLSYTQFETLLTLSTETEDSWKFEINVENSGIVEGREVVQLYAWPSGQESERQLVSFEKTPSLSPGQSSTLELVVRRRELAIWEGDQNGHWVLPKGTMIFATSRHAGERGSEGVKVYQALERVWKASDW